MGSFSLNSRFVSSSLCIATWTRPWPDLASGMSTILFKMEPGSVVPLHEHTSVEQTYMLEGSLEDAEGRCGPGSFVWRPGGNTHVAHSPNGAVFLSFFTKPNRFFGGEKFFTEPDA